MLKYLGDKVYGLIYKAWAQLYVRRYISFIVLTKEQLATINALATKAANPDYIIIKRNKTDDRFRYVSFSKVVGGNSYQSAEYPVKFNGESDFLNKTSMKEPDETAN